MLLEELFLLILPKYVNFIIKEKKIVSKVWFDYSEETKDSFTEVYRIESDESLIFEFGEGKLIGMVFLDKSGGVIATYEIHYASKGGKKSLFDYEGYKVTEMRISEETTDTTEE